MTEKAVVYLLQIPSAIFNQTLFQIVNNYPVCEKWILLLRDINQNLNTYSQSALLRISSVSISIEKVLSWIQDNNIQSVESTSYLQTLATGAHTIGTQCYMSAINATGDRDITLTSDAVNALDILKQWDSVLNLYTPSAPDNVGLRLVRGCTA